MPTVVTAILLDPEARANDAGGNDLPTDGHLQEPALFIPGFVRAFSGTMTPANYYSQTLAMLGEDIYNPASVFNYFSPGYTLSGTGGLKGPEFQIDNPNAAIVRENLVAQSSTSTRIQCRVTAPEPSSTSRRFFRWRVRRQRWSMRSISR
jgi:uncharacterized protein (DUF1800 family)